jgi:sulfur carrier protein ThiS
MVHCHQEETLEETMIVTVRSLGAEPRHVEVPDGSSVEHCLQQADAPTTGITASINGQTVNMATTVRHKQTILVSTKVAGGSSY